MADVHKNKNFVEISYRGKLVLVLHSIIDNHLKTLLAQLKKNINTHKYNNYFTFT